MTDTDDPAIKAAKVQGLSGAKLNGLIGLAAALVLGAATFFAGWFKPNDSHGNKALPVVTNQSATGNGQGTIQTGAPGSTYGGGAISDPNRQPQPPVTQPSPPRPAKAAKEVCATSWRINYWAAQVCSTIGSDGSTVSGHLTINCYKNQSDYVPCQTIRIRELEMFVDDLKLAKWVGGTYTQGDLTTGAATYPCTAGKTYYLKGWEITIQGPDGTWSDSKTIGPEFTYQC